MRKNKYLYTDITFPQLPNRPFFYSDFVTTIDGKVFVQKKGYWPIGSNMDYDVFTYMRAHADIILDGKNTALQFGGKTIETIHRKDFLEIRRSLGKKQPIQYAVVTHTITPKLITALANPFGFKPIIFVSSNAKQQKSFHAHVNSIPITPVVTIDRIARYLFKQKFSAVFVDGGPTLVRQLLSKNLLDELFITIAPKIFGNEKNATLTMVEGGLFLPSDIKHFQLVSVHSIADEVYLRYRIKRH